MAVLSAEVLMDRTTIIVSSRRSLAPGRYNNVECRHAFTCATSVYSDGIVVNLWYRMHALLLRKATVNRPSVFQNNYQNISFYECTPNPHPIWYLPQEQCNIHYRNSGTQFLSTTVTFFYDHNTYANPWLPFPPIYSSTSITCDFFSALGRRRNFRLPTSLMRTFYIYFMFFIYIIYISLVPARRLPPPQ